jgi:hypothetical protein
MEILKIMDKPKFVYDLDVGPQNHIYYFITASLYSIKGVNKIDIAKTNLPPVFYEKILFLIEAIHKNRNRTIFYKKLRKNKNDNTVESDETLHDLSKHDVIFYMNLNRK